MFALSRQTDLAIQVGFHCLFSTAQARLRRYVPWAAMVLPAPKTRQSPYNIWNALLAALVHFRIDEVLQPLLTSEEMGLVALSFHFACDALCAELYDWDAAECG